jgi:DNA polymerase I-like protein with 3'-5' exonuclease and polymerase domains
MADKDTGWLLSDQRGLLVDSLLKGAGLTRRDCAVYSVYPCPVPGDNPAQTGARVRKLAKAWLKDGGKGTPPPAAPEAICPAPKGLVEALGQAPVFALGVAALRAVAPPDLGDRSLDDVRGTVWQRKDGGWTGTSFDPSRLSGDPALMPVWISDLRKLLAYHGGFRWLEIDTSDGALFPSLEQTKRDLRELAIWSRETRAAGGEGAVAYDTETDGISALTANLRCVQFSNGIKSIIVPVRHNDGREYRGYSERLRILRWFFENVPVFGHNAGNYDALVIEQALGVTPQLVADTILLDQLSDNNLRHGLGFAVSYRTMAPDAWKADHAGTDASSERELYEYAVKDVHRTWLLREKLEPIVSARGQRHLVDRELTLQLVGKKMTRLGIKVDIEATAARRIAVRARHAGTLASIRAGLPAAWKTLNVGSPMQLGELLYGDTGWKLAVPEYSETTGDPSVGDSALRKMLIEWTLSDEQRDIIKLIRVARSDAKLLGTYLEPMIPWGQTYKTASGEERTGIIGPDGRVHSSYSRLPSSGRYSSGDPNVQNIDSETRELYVPEPGNVFIGCDSKALELACIAEIARASHIIDWFNTPALCPHNETMEGVYGPGIWQMQGAPKVRGKKGDPGSVFYNTRGLIKNVRYASIYAAGAPTVWKQVTAAEDKQRNLLYAAITLPMVRNILEKMRALDPEIPAWWDLQKRHIASRGYVEDPLWGRRRYLPVGANLSEIVNHPVQAMGFVIVAESMIELLYGAQPWFSTYACDPRPDFDPNLFRFLFTKKQGQVTNTHDSLVWELPEDKGAEGLAALQWAMTRKTKAFGYLRYDAEGKQGTTWEAV